VKAKKRFGQHFLEPAWVEKLLKAIDPQRGDVFLEIGPGRGALTRPLAERVRRVIAFEIDRDLAADLREESSPHVTIREGDFLDVSAATIAAALNSEPGSRSPEPRLRAAGNLPYNVASPIMFKLLELHASGLPLADATLMLQREVADRLVSKPGTKEYGVLSVLIQHHASVEKVLSLPPGAFRPAPKVHSAVVRLRFHAPKPEPISQGLFVALTQAIFTRRRKTVANALLAFEPSGRFAPQDALRVARIDGVRRPETLSVTELVHLSDAYARAVL
jgi:16S rRNA (adenine1518-N6/adenine1519-N6)-dimethyltransferase